MGTTGSLTDLIQHMKKTDMQTNHKATIMPLTNSKSSQETNLSLTQKDNHNQRPLIASNEEDENTIDIEAASFQVEAVSMQLFGLHHKLINVSLRLAEHHLRNYWSSSVMQALRTSARRIADAVALLSPLGLLVSAEDETKESLKKNNATESPQRIPITPMPRPSSFLQQILHQYARLWEYCGHFARSFAADDLWREQGHACGEDVVALLQD